MKEMRILIVASFPESILVFRGALLRDLRTAGMEVHVAAPDLPDGNLIRARLQEMAVTVHDVPLSRTSTNPVDDIIYCRRLFALLRRTRPQIILCYTIKPVIYGLLAASAARVSRRFALITGLGYAFTGRNGLLPWMIGKLYGMSISRATKVFFQNKDDRALFLGKGLLHPAIPSVVVNGSGVDLGEYSQKPLVRGPLRFLMIARLLGDKGVRQYVEAARCVRLKHPHVRFQLVGWIDSNPDAIDPSELAAWVQEGVVEYLGRLDDVRPVIEACSVYVLPSYREGMPRTVLEAMAIGRAVITTDAPGCRETVVDHENGYLVPVKSVDELVAAMLRFVDNPLFAEVMGARSREIAEVKYDVRAVNRKMLVEMGILTRMADEDRSCPA